MAEVAFEVASEVAAPEAAGGPVPVSRRLERPVSELSSRLARQGR